MGQITELVSQAHLTAREKHFWDTTILFEAKGQDIMVRDDRQSISHQMLGNRLMHVTRELGEAWEELRCNGLTDHFAEEMADAVIVLFDLAGKTGIPLEEVILAKMNKNKERPDKHGKKF